MTTAPPTDLAAWLLERIAEDEAVARAATAGPWTWHPVSNLHADSAGWIGSPGGLRTSSGVFVAEVSNTLDGLDDGAHIARHDPARVLATCAAHRRIVEEHSNFYDNPYAPASAYGPECKSCGSPGEYGVDWPCPTLRALASIYADRDGFREEWR